MIEGWGMIELCCLRVFEVWIYLKCGVSVKYRFYLIRYMLFENLV